jgi:hypothetical protein
MAEPEEIEFDCDTMPSELGRMVRLRENLSDKWRYGVPVHAVTAWTTEDYRGDGVMCRVERPTGGYQVCKALSIKFKATNLRARSWKLRPEP